MTWRFQVESTGKLTIAWRSPPNTRYGLGRIFPTARAARPLSPPKPWGHSPLSAPRNLLRRRQSREACGSERLLTLSCKQRGICPSCDAKRATAFAGREWLGHSDSRTTRFHEMFHPFRLLRYRHERWQSIQRRGPFVGVLHTDKSFTGNRLKIADSRAMAIYKESSNSTNNYDAMLAVGSDA